MEIRVLDSIDLSLTDTHYCQYLVNNHLPINKPHEIHINQSTSYNNILMVRFTRWNFGTLQHCDASMYSLIHSRMSFIAPNAGIH